MSEVRCEQPDCPGGGFIEDDGYCSECGWPPTRQLAGSSSSPSSHTSGPTTAIPRAAPLTTTISMLRIGGGLVEVEPDPPRDPSDDVEADLSVPERQRFCREHEPPHPVGRSPDGRSGGTSAECDLCHKWYSFTPDLAPGDLVKEQYEVVGCIAQGGLGWIYLAKDLRVGAWRVLKGLLDSHDANAVEVAIAERGFLAAADHPNIVKIINFVEHDGGGYIVMEYVGGTSLHDLLADRRAANGSHPDPLPADEAIGYVLEMLPALGYLHANGLVYCDLKPDNVIRTQHGVKLIDLGAVCRITDHNSQIYGTAGYKAPEIAQFGPSVASDIYTVARTLAVLSIDFEGYQGTYQYTLPGPDRVPLFAHCDSLYRLLLKATSSNPADRFQSAAEMSDQLFGVLHELLAARDGVPSPTPSRLFTGDLRARPDQVDWRLLPRLRVPTDDPASAYLAMLTATDPDDLVALLSSAPEQTNEVQLRLARVLIEAGRLDAAAEVLDGIDDVWEWRVDWYQGLIALARDDAARARKWFDLVYRAVPGELAPKLALGVADEQAGDQAEAAGWYDTVSRTDPGYTTATFGLARCRSAGGDRAGALAAYDRVPESSIAYLDAMVAKVHLRLGRDDGVTPDLDDLAAAQVEIDALDLDAEPRMRLVGETYETALGLVEDGLVEPDPAARIFGRPLTEPDLRLGLESTYRTLARYADTSGERIRLVDRANQVRPRTLT